MGLKRCTANNLMLALMQTYRVFLVKTSGTFLMVKKVELGTSPVVSNNY